MHRMKRIKLHDRSFRLMIEADVIDREIERVGFYVLLLFDIVLCIQIENLTAITASEQTMAAYLQNSFFSAGYLMAASIVALKCLNLVPDLAAWMIPEGDTAFSTRNFGEGVAQQAKMTATGGLGGIMR